MVVEVAGSLEGDPVAEGMFQGRPFAIRASAFLTQAVDHATEHGSQVKTVMSQNGIEPPDVDGWASDRELGG